MDVCGIFELKAIISLQEGLTPQYTEVYIQVFKCIIELPRNLDLMVLARNFIWCSSKFFKQSHFLQIYPFFFIK